MNYNQLQRDVEQYVIQYFNSHQNKNFVYHNIDHTLEVVQSTIQIANHYQLNDADFFIVFTGAWFHDTGYFIDPKHHEENSAALADEFLKGLAIDSEIRDQVKAVILATKIPQLPTTLLEKILCDGDLYHLGINQFKKKSKLMQKENALINEKKLTKNEWKKKDIQFLENQNFHTDYCRLLLNDQKMKNLDQIKRQFNEIEKKEQKSPKADAQNEDKMNKTEKLLNKKDKQRPDKGIETMFRITSTNNQRLSDMADNKAQLLITVNSIILSLIVSLVFRKLEDNVFMIVPTLILLIVSLTCIVFSILATRPSIPDGLFTDNDIKSKKVNLLFFGNFYKMPLSEYSNGMIKVMNDQEFLYGTLITDVYSQGVVLGRKYKLIRIAYNVFMFGLITAVLAYIISYVGYGKLS